MFPLVIKHDFVICGTVHRDIFLQ